METECRSLFFPAIGSHCYAFLFAVCKCRFALPLSSNPKLFFAASLMHTDLTVLEYLGSMGRRVLLTEHCFTKNRRVFQGSKYIGSVSL